MTFLIGLITSRGGLLLIAALGVFIYYEGLPIGPFGRIPVIGPVLQEMTDGRVDRERKAAREGYVLEARAIAAEAQNKELKRQLLEGQEALKRYNDLLIAKMEADKVEDDANERARAEYQAAIAACSNDITDDDYRFLQRNQSR